MTKRGSNEYIKEQRQEAVRQVSRLMQKEFVVLDTETTDLPKNGGEAVQIGIVDKEGKTLFNHLLKPKNPIGLAAQRIHHITNEKVKDAPTLPDVLEEFESAVRHKIVVAYNVEFDRAIMINTYKKWGIGMLPSLEWLCAMLEYARFAGKWDTYHESFRWAKLVEACADLGLAEENAHDALGDVRMTLAVIKKMAAYNQPRLELY